MTSTNEAHETTEQSVPEQETINVLDMNMPLNIGTLMELVGEDNPKITAEVLKNIIAGQTQGSYNLNQFSPQVKELFDKLAATVEHLGTKSVVLSNEVESLRLEVAQLRKDAIMKQLTKNVEPLEVKFPDNPHEDNTPIE